MSVRRILLWSTGTLLLLVLAVAAGVYWAGRSETFLRWGIDRFASSLPCSLKVEGLKGAFMKPVQVEHLVCENTGYRIEARDVALVWSPLLLADRRLDITSLQMQSLAYTSKAQATPASEPVTDVGLPIRVDIASLKIASLLIHAGEQPLELTAIDAAYHGNARSHRLQLHNVESAWGSATADATLAAPAPFALSAHLTVDTNHFEGWPASASVGLKGDLLGQLSATFNAQSRGITVDGTLALAPFDAQPVKSLTVHTANVDAAMFDARLPHTALAINVEATPRDNSSLTGHVRAENSAAGRLDEKKLPVRNLQANFAANIAAPDQASLQLSDLQLDLGKAGSASGSAVLARDHATLSLKVHDLDLQAARADLHQTRLNGTISVEQRDARQLVALDLREQKMRLEARGEVNAQRIDIERMTARAGGAQLQGSATVQLDDELGFSVDGTLSHFDPARFGDFPQADLNARLQVSGRVRPEWRVQVRYRFAPSQLDAVALGGEGTFALTPTRLHAADAQLDYGGNHIKLSGGFGANGDVLHFAVDAKHLERLAKDATGRVLASGELSGTLKRAAIRAEVEGRAIRWSGLSVDRVKTQFSVNRFSANQISANQFNARQVSAGQGDDVSLHGQARLQGIRRGNASLDSLTTSVDGTLAKHRIDVALKAPDLELSAQLDGGWDTSRRLWSGNLNRLANQGEYAFDMQHPARLELAEDHFVLGATRVGFSKTEIDLEETRYENGKLAAKGSVNGLRLARLLQLMKKPPAVESTVVLGGRWEIRADKTVDGFIELSRSGGDLVIAGEEPLALGLKEFRVVARAKADRVTGEAVLRSAHGDARFSAQTRLENRDGKWGIAGNAPIELTGDVNMQSIRPLATLASRAVTADGQLKLAVKASGTIAEPRLSGSVEGDNLKFEHVADGIFLHDGVMRASFGENALTLTQFRFRAGEGEVTAKGRFNATGASPVMQLQWSARKLAAIQHPELRLTVSGAGELAYRNKIMSLKGELSADKGRVILRNRTFPSLGDDVVVAGREKPSQIAAETKRTLLDLKLDLGPDFTIVGRGLDARMEGQVHLTSAPDKPLSAKGEVKVANGTFDAYGRRLQIDKGTIYFAGPVDNPSLNIRAMRKNQQVEAGVEITGTARDPRVRLVSDPNVPDPNKLEWLVLGREAESGSSQDSRELQSSAVALAAGLGTTPLQQQLARAVGLDEINFIPGSNGSEGVVAIGKQISNKIYVTQEFSANAAGDTFRISYQLTRHWSLRSESGQTDAVDLFFTFSFD